LRHWLNIKVERVKGNKKSFVIPRDFWWEVGSTYFEKGGASFWQYFTRFSKQISTK